MLRDLDPRQRAIFWSVAVVCALTRLLAMARSIWDWDEALFCLGLRSYDVTQHHPHPPGFPVYIAAAKVFRLLIPSDFRALQAVNLVAAVLVFPAMFLLARELRMRFETSVIAATLFAFFPNVWFFGGTAFSDIPSIVLVLFAVVYLLRGRDSTRDYWVGTLLLALAIGIRPQNLLVGLFPGILATRRRPPRDVIVAVLIGVLVVGIAYGSAIAATGKPMDYRNTVRAHADYIARVDSFRAPMRPPLWRLFDRFFLKQYQSPPFSVLTSIFVAISIIGAIRARDRAMLYNFLIFAPFALSAWMMLDRFSINRFSIGYAPMFAIFAADGISRLSRGSRAAEAALVAVLAGGFVIWTLPALGPVRRDIAPPALAVETAAGIVRTTRAQLFVAQSMVPFAEYLAPSIHFVRVQDENAVPLAPVPRGVLVAEVFPEPGPGVVMRERGRLWNIARRHYFGVVVRPLPGVAQFGEGWYPPEQERIDQWRWMRGRSVTTLPPAQGDDLLLRLNFTVPEELLPKKPRITVALDGRVLDEFQPVTVDMVREYHVKGGQAGSPVLELSTDKTMTINGRESGLRVRFISWGRV